MKTLSRLFLIILAFTLILSPPNGALLAEEAPKHVENLIIGTLYANNTFNMTGQKDAFGRMNYNGLTQGNFVYSDANGNLQPYFFRTFEVSEDGTVLDFTWHKGAMWHDGQPVTNEDIIFSFEYMRDVKKVSSLSSLENRVNW